MNWLMLGGAALCATGVLITLGLVGTLIWRGERAYPAGDLGYVPAPAPEERRKRLEIWRKLRLGHRLKLLFLLIVMAAFAAGFVYSLVVIGATSREQPIRPPPPR